jgi:tRNA (cmo5U34)-methyltransferase
MSTSSWRDGQFHFDPETYLELVLAEVPLYAELQRRTAEATVGVSAVSILDLGAGTGETSAAVKALHPSARLTGVDESPEMLEHARRRLPEAEFFAQRLQDPLPAGTFDLVVSALAIHHLDGEDKADLFRRIAGVLRPGGRFVMADVVMPSDPADVVTPIDDGVHDKPSSVDDQIAWLRSAGLRPEVRWSARDLVVMAAERPVPAR